MAFVATEVAEELMQQLADAVPAFADLDLADQQAQRDGFMLAVAKTLEVVIKGGTGLSKTFDGVKLNWVDGDLSGGATPIDIDMVVGGSLS